MKMTLKSVFIAIVAFMIGMVSAVSINYYSPINNQPSVTTTTYALSNEQTNDDTGFITRILNLNPDELASPQDWIPENNIRVEKDKVIIYIEDAQWARFTDTNSMDPVLDDGSNAIQIPPEKPEDIQVGDIVSYKSQYNDGRIIHRVVETGYDKDGWYCIMKGDNNKNADPGKIRFEDIYTVTIGILY